MEGPEQHGEFCGESPRNFSVAEERRLLSALKLFVELSGLRVPRVAKLMGVGEATLYKWLDGTAKPTQKKLLEIQSFLVWHGREYLAKSERRE